LIVFFQLQIKNLMEIISKEQAFNKKTKIYKIKKPQITKNKIYSKI